jgi:hypothetical protein
MPWAFSEIGAQLMETRFRARSHLTTSEQNLGVHPKKIEVVFMQSSDQVLLILNCIAQLKSHQTRIQRKDHFNHFASLGGGWKSEVELGPVFAHALERFR